MRTLLLLAVLASLPLQTACSGPRPVENPASVAVDREKSANQRSRAIEQLAAELNRPPTPQRRAEIREQLKAVAWGRRNPSSVRTAAVDALQADDEADTRAMLRLMLPTESAPETLRDICDRAEANGWTELTPALVRSWSRPLPTLPADARPERDTLAALHPTRPLEDVVFEVFATPAPDSAFGDKERRAAWEVLGILDPTGSAAAQRLAMIDASDDPLVRAVQSSANDLGAVPVTQEQLEWLTLLRDPAQRRFYESARRLVGALTPEQRKGLAIRHAAALVAADALAPERLTKTRAELLSELAARISTRRTTARSAEGGTSASSRERLSTNEPNLSYADALHLLMIDDAIHEPATIRLLFEMADRDHKDTSTEYGGLLRPVDGNEANGYEPVLYPPRPAQRRNDKTFIAAPEMFTQHPDALAHFHYHVQDERNSSYAGPGPGDHAYADSFGRANVVLTFVSPDELAVDYYQPAGVIVDLGRIDRPASE